jgi:hypothetical protein
MLSTSLALSVGFLYKIIVIVRPFLRVVLLPIRVKKQEPKCR